MSPRAPLAFDPIAEAYRQWQREGWDDPVAIGMAAITSLMRVDQLLMEAADATLEPYNLTYSRFQTLMILYLSQRKSLPAGTIGARLGLHPASVTNALDRLEKQSLVKRTPSPDDGRRVIAELTRRGERTARAAAATMNERFFATLPVDLDEAATLFRILRKIRVAGGDFTDDDDTDDLSDVVGEGDRAAAREA